MPEPRQPSARPFWALLRMTAKGRPSPGSPSTLVGTSEADSRLSERPRAGHTALLALARWLQRRRHDSPDTAPPDLAPAADRPTPQAGGPDRPDGLAPARSRPRGGAG